MRVRRDGGDHPSGNQLAAYDRKTGKPLWRVGRTGDPKDPLGAVRFMAPPVPCGRHLLVPVVAEDELSVAALDPGSGALRWVRGFDNNLFAVGVVWIFSLVLVCTILRRGTGRRVQRKALLLRLPAALFVFLLLVLNAGGSGLLVIYALAFVPPYLTMMAQQYKT